MTLCDNSLAQLGMTPPIKDNYLAIIKAIKCLTDDRLSEAGQYLGVDPDSLRTVPTRLIAQQVYAYLVKWTSKTIYVLECVNH